LIVSGLSVVARPLRSFSMAAIASDTAAVLSRMRNREDRTKRPYHHVGIRG
jgi:hypothetical protein